MKGQIHKHPKANTNGFKQNPMNINRSGKNRSLMSSIKRAMESETEYIEFENVDVISENGAVEETLKKVRIKLPSTDAIALHYLKKSFKSDRILIDLMNRLDRYGESVTPTFDEQVKKDDGHSIFDLMTPLELELFDILLNRFLIVNYDDNDVRIPPEGNINYHSLVKKYDRDGNRNNNS